MISILFHDLVFSCHFRSRRIQFGSELNFTWKFRRLLFALQISTSTHFVVRTKWTCLVTFSNTNREWVLMVFGFGFDEY